MRLAMSCSPFPLPFSTSTVAQTRCRNFPTGPPPLQLGQHQSCNAVETESSPTRPKTIRFRLSQLCKQGSLQLARELFDTIPQPTTVLWNTLIIGYICNNLPYEAISLYSRMLSTSVTSQKCDAYTYSSVLKACAETKQLLIGKSLHCHILRSNVYPSRILYNSLLNMYASCLLSSGLYLVERVFRTMRKRNVVSWNIMISSYEKTGQLLKALMHFVMMVKTGFSPTVVSFINVFPAISGIGDIEFASVVYGLVLKLGDEYVNDLFVVSSAITMYSELGCLELARKIFDNCSEKNAHVWNAMIGGYVQNACPILALEHLKKHWLRKMASALMK